ncbi:MAG: T9SS type A sorting domain-containing protein, partial [Ferruginibacter sp.]
AGTYTYSWTSNPAGFTSALQNPFVTPSINTTYTVTMSDGTSSANSSVNIIVNQIPTTPVITLTGSVLSSTSATAYQWYLNNAIIPGATSQNYTPLQNGNYQVIITNAGGCKSALSAVYAITNTGIAMLQNQPFTVFPNPTDGIINIKDITENNEFMVLVYDITGKKCFEKANEKQIDISSLDNGMYFLEIFSQNKKVYSTKISLNKF